MEWRRVGILVIVLRQGRDMVESVGSVRDAVVYAGGVCIIGVGWGEGIGEEGGLENRVCVACGMAVV